MIAPSERPPGQPQPAHLSPKAAAHLAKVSRRTIMRAIEDHELPAIRDNRGNWRIAPADLERWARERPAPSSRPVGDHPAAPTPAHPPAHLEIAGLRALIARMGEDHAAEVERLEREHAAQVEGLERELAAARSETAAQAEATAAAQAEAAAIRQHNAELQGQAREAAAWRDALIARLPDPAPRRRWRFW